MAKEETEGIEGVKLLTSTSFRTWNVEILLYLESKGLKGFIEDKETKPTVPASLEDWDELTDDEKTAWTLKRGQSIYSRPDTNPPVIDLTRLAACEPAYCKEQDRIEKRVLATQEKLKDFEKRYAKARQILYQSVSRSLRPTIVSLTSPKEIYDRLTKELNKKNSNSNNVIRERLKIPWKWGSTASWDAYLANWTDTIAELKENNAVIVDEEVNNQLKDNLPREELAVYIENLEDKLEDEEMTHTAFVTKVRNGVTKRILQAERTGSAFRTTQQTTTSHQSKRDVVCNHCKKPRHTENDCWQSTPI